MVRGTIALFAGIGLLVLACVWVIEGIHFSGHSLLASGEIVGVRESGGSQTGFSFHPVVQFNTKEGQVVTAVAGEDMGSQYVTGQRVEVFYDPAKSSYVQLGTRSRQWAPILFAVVLGCVLFTVGLLGTLPSGLDTRLTRWLGKLAHIPGWAFALFMVLGFAGAVLSDGLEEHEIKTMRGVCSRDADCPSTFCDRGLCAPNLGDTPHFGRPCTPSTAPATGKERGDAATCGPFVCFEGRCRSCVKGGECQAGAEWAQLCMGSYWGLSACADHPGEIDP